MDSISLKVSASLAQQKTYFVLFVMKKEIHALPAYLHMYSRMEFVIVRILQQPTQILSQPLPQIIRIQIPQPPLSLQKQQKYWIPMAVTQSRSFTLANASPVLLNVFYIKQAENAYSVILISESLSLEIVPLKRVF